MDALNQRNEGTCPATDVENAVTGVKIRLLEEGFPCAVSSQSKTARPSRARPREDRFVECLALD